MVGGIYRGCMARRRRWQPWNPRSWAGLSPNGIGQQKPNHYAEMGRAIIENRRHPLYAWRVLRQGVCDGCALGVSGFHDWTIEGVHLCTTRLKLLSLNTADAFDPARLADVSELERMTSTELRALGRLAYPMVREAGTPGFHRVSWDEALDIVATAVREAGDDRTAMYLTSRGLTNEVYYVAGKAARAMGIASVDSAARVCHAPSTLALKDAIGAAAATCSLRDVLEADLVVLIGCNPANNQPVFMKYLYEAKRAGAKVAVVNPYLEPGLERYWVPSSLESALFGTKICDYHVPLRPGSDVALLNAVLKLLIEENKVDVGFISSHTEGWDGLCASLDTQPMEELLDACGLSRAQVTDFAGMYAAARGAVIVWSMGITQRADSVDAVHAIVNLALARANIGRNGAGLVPLRGHSGVQGGAEMGAYATGLPGGAAVNKANAEALAALWGFPVPDAPGLTAPEMVEAAEAGTLDVIYLSGGNFAEVLPDSARARSALSRVRLRVHQDIVVSTQMLLPPAAGGRVVLLPAATRYEQEGGGTETTTERRIVFSPEIPGHRVGEARSEWRIFADVAARVRPGLAGCFAWPSNAALRAEIARVVPLYAGIEQLARAGDQVQWGGRHLAAGGTFPTPSGRGRFMPVVPVRRAVPEGSFVVSTRRGKQFNSMVHASRDPLNGARRDHVLMDEADAARLGLREEDQVVLRSSVGELSGRVRLTRLPAGTLQVHWPEANVLVPGGAAHREERSRVPDYNVVVTLEPIRAPVPRTG